MATIAIVASPNSFTASLGALTDAHSRLGEAFAANPALGDYSRMQTCLALVSTDGGRVTLAGGRSMDTDMPLRQLVSPRIVYLPSFQIADTDRLRDLMDDAAPLHDWLRKQHAAGLLIGAAGASVCHLAAAGLLDGRPAAVHPRLLTSFRRLFPAVALDTLNPVVRADRVMTCGPDIANARLVFHLIAAGFGVGVARNLFHREPDESHASSDPVVGEAKLWMHERFARNFQISELASVLGVSHQTLLRRFHAAGEESPRAYAQKIRADSAAIMLTETRRSVAEIGQLVGYSDIASFRKMFGRRMGMTPGAYRRASRKKG